MRGANGDGRSDGFTQAEVERAYGKNCNCGINGEENAGRLDREGIGAGDMWTNIPSLPLSMIFERLDLPNRLRFVAVCKSWRSESSSFPQHEVGMPPWIMVTENLSSTGRELISISSLEKYSFDRPDFASSKCLASKEGWLLLLVDDTENMTYSLFFLNSFTKERIELALLNKFYKNEQPPLAAFTTKDGYPIVWRLLSWERGLMKVRSDSA